LEGERLAEEGSLEVLVRFCAALRREGAVKVLPVSERFIGHTSHSEDNDPNLL
jgi:hypothetical protein